MITTPDDLITPRRAAAILCCGVATVYRYMARGRLPAWQRENRYLLSEEQVRGLLSPVAPGPRPHNEKRGAAHLQAMEKLRRAGIGSS